MARYSKILAIGILTAAMASAQAFDVETDVGRNGGYGSNNAAISISETLPGDSGINLGLSFERSTIGDQNTNDYAFFATKRLFEYKDISLFAKAGMHYLNPEYYTTGYAWRVGVGIRYQLPVKDVALVAQYGYQLGQNRVRQYNGNQVSAGVQYSF